MNYYSLVLSKILLTVYNPQCTEKVEQGTFRENFKNFHRDPHSNVSYGLNGLKLEILDWRAIFGNSEPGFEPTTLKSLLKSTCAGRGHFELLLSPLPSPGKQKKGYNFFSCILFWPPESSRGSALRSSFEWTLEILKKVARKKSY